jgi:hypothetical protein
MALDRDEVPCDNCGHASRFHPNTRWDSHCSKCEEFGRKCEYFITPHCERCDVDGHRKGEACLDSLAERVAALEKWRHG